MADLPLFYMELRGRWSTRTATAGMPVGDRYAAAGAGAGAEAITVASNRLPVRTAAHQGGEVVEGADLRSRVRRGQPPEQRVLPARRLDVRQARVRAHKAVTASIGHGLTRDRSRRCSLETSRRPIPVLQ